MIRLVRENRAPEVDRGCLDEAVGLQVDVESDARVVREDGPNNGRSHEGARMERGDADLGKDELIDDDSVRFERYQRLQRYVGWSDDDATIVVLLRPVLTPSFDAVIRDFYDRIMAFSETRDAITEGEAQVARLMVTLRQWLDELLSGPYDAGYVSRRWQIGRRHVQIGLEQSFVAAAMSRLRQNVVRGLHAAFRSSAEVRAAISPSNAEEGLERSVIALNRLFDLELAIVEWAYREEFTRRDQQIQRMATLGQVAGGIAHELRNPLNVVKTSVYFLQNAKQLTDEKRAEHLARIERQVDLANDVISAITQFARIAAPEKRVIDLRASLPEWVENHCLSGNVERVFHLETVPGLLGDPRQLQIAVGNIVRNACEAMSSGGQLILTLRKSVGGLELLIADTGHGIPAEQLKRITEPWYSTKARGAGLGLAITKAILEKHDALLHVTSEMGAGSKFSLRFPAHVLVD